MIIRVNLSKRRKIILAGGFCSLVGISLIKELFTKNIKARNISEMPEEYAMLTNLAVRRTSLKKESLVIRNANFDENFDKYIACENTIFLNCNFQTGGGLKIKSLTNVKFENCDFNDANISGGVWTDVQFVDCSAQGKFLILADEGSKNVLFQRCSFYGPHAIFGTSHENDFGGVGSLGTSQFNDCTLKYVHIMGETSLTIKDSHLRKVDSSASRKNAVVVLDNVEILEYLDLQQGIFAQLTIRNCKFEFMNLEGIKCNNVLVEGCAGHLVGKFMELKEMAIRDSVFKAGGDRRNPFDNQMAALSTSGSDIGNLTLDGLKFEGVNGTLYIGGSENLLYDKDNPKYEKFEISKFKKISIHRVPLNGSFFGYIKTDELDIVDSSIENTNFGNSAFGRIKFLDVKLAGKIDFSKSAVENFFEKNTITAPTLSLERDEKKMINFRSI